MKSIFTKVNILLITMLVYASAAAQQNNIPPAGNYTVLPVKYVSFTAAANGGGVELMWTADNEVDSSYFDVERSFDGKNFYSTGIIINGLDNGMTNQYHAADDCAVLASRTLAYYRLKEADMTGSVTYSSVAMVRLQAKKTRSLQVWPVPFVQTLFLRIAATQNEAAVIKIMNMNGEVVLKKNTQVMQGENIFQLNDLGFLPKGIYTAQLLIDGLVATHQQIIKG